MRINPINNQNPTILTAENPSFNGRVLTQGKWSKELKEAFLNNPEVKKAAANTEMDIVGIMSRKLAGRSDIYHYPKQPLYQLTIMKQNENPSFIDRIKTFLKIGKKYNVTHDYHGEFSTTNKMQSRITEANIKNKLEL